MPAGLIERALWVADSVREQAWLHRNLGIGASDVVLDVGSGGSPNPRSNVLCDKFVADATERHGQAVRTDRPFVIGDVERLPFRDRAFDYVICAHLLEHVEDPARAIAELERVAPRGYIETPAASWEKVVGYPFHRWLVSVRNGVLVFEGKPAPAYDPALAAWFGSMLRSLAIERRVWFARRRIGVMSTLRWEGRIPFEIVSRPPPGVRFVGADTDGEVSHGSAGASSPGIASRVIEATFRRLRKASDVTPDGLLSRLACPDCRGPLARDPGAGYACAGCRTRFHLDGAGRPELLPRAAPGPGVDTGAG